MLHLHAFSVRKYHETSANILCGCSLCLLYILYCRLCSPHPAKLAFLWHLRQAQGISGKDPVVLCRQEPLQSSEGEPDEPEKMSV